MNKLLKRSLPVLMAVMLTGSTLFGAATSKPAVLSLDYAITCGLAKDNTVSTYNKQIDYYQRVKDFTGDLASDTYKNAKLSKEQMERDKEYVKDKVAYNIENLYYNILLTQKSQDVLKVQISLQEKTIKQNEIKLKQGYLSQLDYDTSVATLEQYNNAYQKTVDGLENMRITFKDTTGIDISKYVLEEDYTYEPFSYEGYSSIESYIDTQLDEYNKFAERQIDLLENSSAYDDDGKTGNYYVLKTKKEYDVASAELGNENLRKAQKSTLLTQYNTLLSTEKDMANLKNTIELGEQQLNKAEIQYNAGYLSLMDYERQQFSQLNNEYNQLSNIINYNLGKTVLEKPWVALS